MVNIAIVEDNENDRQAIAGFIKKYGEENGLSFNVAEFENAITFITNYNPSYDLVFMDIECRTWTAWRARQSCAR